MRPKKKEFSRLQEIITLTVFAIIALAVVAILFFGAIPVFKYIFKDDSSTPSQSDCYGLAGCLSESDPSDTEPDPAADSRADYDPPTSDSTECGNNFSREECDNLLYEPPEEY